MKTRWRLFCADNGRGRLPPAHGLAAVARIQLQRNVAPWIAMSQTTKQQVNQFHTTQQLGFKQIYYCWCGCYIDMNKNDHRALRQFYLAHADVCEPKPAKVALRAGRKVV